MSKPLSLLFAVISTLLMSATAISISHNLWYTLLLSIVTIGFIGIGFIVRGRSLRRQGFQPKQ
ncbi:hypothetical protein [Paenibacillus protaetiae]|uniref:DUF5325 family protein n=1 Tax=Paenibacillus protaetiae TaxID=2509456 RepID=A0A4P6EYK9_9BACL|nr:hypothetical protein [Paenibacillus protaetiae]QAY68192.1 hypothetical protein ET464_19260 [Paenibacillus protaetiae]